MKEIITWNDFEKIDVRVGTVLEADMNDSALKPAIIVKVDFGPEIGVLKSSAQITKLYNPEDLIGQQILGVVNFPPKQIGKMISQFLVLGIYSENSEIVLVQPKKVVKNGLKMG
jgi:tRNA-binding protein